MNQEITIEVDLPEGFKAVAYRPPKKGERYLANNGKAVITAEYDFTSSNFIIVEQIGPRRLWIDVDGVIYHDRKPDNSGDLTEYLEVFEPEPKVGRQDIDQFEWHNGDGVRFDVPTGQLWTWRSSEGDSPGIAYPFEGLSYNRRWFYRRIK